MTWTISVSRRTSQRNGGIRHYNDGDDQKGYAIPFAIDPSVFEVDDGSFWLIHGSHAKGIVNVELDPATGYLKVDPESKMWSPADPRFTTIANYGGSLDENNVEAAYLYKSGNLILSTISMMQNRMMTPVR